MEPRLPPTRPGWAYRLHAVLARLGGAPRPQVTARLGLGRSVFYTWRHRALTALQGALTEPRSGPQGPAQRLSPAREQPLVARAPRPPTWRAAPRQAHAGPEAPSPRPMQRLRHRSQLPRRPKRPAPCRPARRLTGEGKHAARRRSAVKPWLGPERLAWELRHVAPLQLSPATSKRMQHAMPQAQTPPPPAPQWRFSVRHHPQSLWPGDCLETVCDQAPGPPLSQLPLWDD